MKKSLLKLTFFLVFTQPLFSQNASLLPLSNSAKNEAYTRPKHSETINFDVSKYYLDASVGYFPFRHDAAYLAQLGAGYRLDEKSAVGIGGGIWGRNYHFTRFTWGMGAQYRRTMWEKVVAKMEVGYVLGARFYNELSNEKLVYLPKESTPAYLKVEAHYRFSRRVSIGLSAAESANLIFKDKDSILNRWRINAVGIHLGLLLDSD